MKLSTVTTNGAADILVLIAPEIETLIGDSKLAEKLKNRKTTTDKGEATKFGMVTILDLAAYLLKNHRETTWNILGALNNKTPEEIGNQLLPVTMKQIVEVLSDKDLLSFFTLSEQSVPEPSSESLPE